MREPLEQKPRMRAALLISILLVWALGGFAGAALAWATNRPTEHIFGAAVIGCLTSMVLTWHCWRIRQRRFQVFDGILVLVGGLVGCCGGGCSALVDHGNTDPDVLVAALAWAVLGAVFGPIFLRLWAWS